MDITEKHLSFSVTSCAKCGADLEEFILGLFLKVQAGLRENLMPVGNK